MAPSSRLGGGSGSSSALLEKRQGPSISVKMILTTTALIVMIVVGFGLLNVWTIGRVFDENVVEKERLIREQLGKIGSATVRAVAASSRSYLEVNNDADLRHYIVDLVKKDPQISYVYVLDGNQGLIAHSDEGKNPKEGHPPFAHEAWKRAQEVWKARRDKPGQQDPLIASEELPGVNRTPGTALFALPVFQTNVPSTTAGIFDPANAPLGYVVVGYGYGDLVKAVADAQRQKERAYRDAGIKTAGVGAIFVLLGTLLAILQGLRISKPIKMLAWRADQIARGDLETRVDVSSTDEIGMLGENFNYMADQLVVLLRQTAEKATLEKELEVARAIQETLVPGQDTVDRSFVKLAGFFQPASQCGGDWWTYHDLKDGKVLVVIGDVTGHGVPSAMITAAAKAACDVARAVTGDDVGCAQLLEIMNRAIFESAKRKFVMTCFASIIDPQNRTITYANAGHNFPYLYREQNGKGEFGSLMTRGNRLGDLSDSKYAAKSTELLSGDVLIWYTDGIVECENENGEEYGEKRFRSAIRRASAMEPADMRDTVVTASSEFFGDRPHKDDITLVFARIY
jgi:serine phosphatase RsbU (regulator of sigma subunit)